MKKARKKETVNKDKDLRKTYVLLFQSTYVLYFYLIGIFLTAYVRDAYFDIMEAKASFFLLSMRILLPFLILTIVYKYFLLKKRFITDLLDLSLLVILGSYVISSIFSADLSFAFNGDGGWHVGLRSILYLFIVYIALKEEDIRIKNLYVPLIIVCLLEFLLTISDGAGMDLFSFRKEVITSNYYIFYATIGNANWYVGLLSLLVPLFLILFVSEERRSMSILYFVTALSGIIASIINGADGVYLAFGLCAFFMIPYLFDSILRIRKAGLICFATGLSLFLIRVLPAFHRRLAVLHGFGRILFMPVIDIVLVVLGVLLFLSDRFMSEERYDTYKRRIVIFLEAVLVLLAAGVGFYVFGSASADVDNGRLLIWERSWQAYRDEYSIFMKFFGIGPELQQLVYQPLSEKFGVLYNASHSEAVQLLLTNGILGLISYLFFWGVIFASFFRPENKDTLMTAIYMGLIAYFGQSLVNSATLLNLCAFLMFLILLKQNRRILALEPEKEKRSEKIKK